MKWLLTTVSSFFINPESYLMQCQSNYQKMSRENLIKFGKTAAMVGTGSGLIAYIAGGLLHSGNFNLGLVSGVTIGSIYMANRISEGVGV